MASLNQRVSTLERAAPSPKTRCPHPGHDRVPDYREAAAVLSPDHAESERAYRAQFCPDCGEPFQDFVIQAMFTHGRRDSMSSSFKP